MINEIQSSYDQRLDLGTSGSSNAPSRNTKKGSICAATAHAVNSAHSHQDTVGSVGSGIHTSIRSRIQKSAGGHDVPVRSLAASLKYPYKRTISAPAGMGLSVASRAGLLQQQTSSGQASLSLSQHAPYSRQQSVPLMKGPGGDT